MTSDKLAAALVDLLSCPACEGALRAEGDATKCEGCGARYPIVDGVLDFLAPPSHDSKP